MGVLAKKMWRNPVLFGAAALVVLNAVLLLPDWKAAVGSTAAQIAAALGVRRVVSPTKG